jgi:hypothetical protein
VRNPTTRRSLRAPKIKEEEIGEGYSPSTIGQFEYTPRVEPVIKTSTKKAFSNLRYSLIQKKALDPR